MARFSFDWYSGHVYASLVGMCADSPIYYCVHALQIHSISILSSYAWCVSFCPFFFVSCCFWLPLLLLLQHISVRLFFRWCFSLLLFSFCMSCRWNGMILAAATAAAAAVHQINYAVDFVAWWILMAINCNGVHVKWIWVGANARFFSRSQMREKCSLWSEEIYT